ncbi:YbhB/YbcL family Raf kinase inhibitor-like protein [Motilimonas pumila]|uniref:YbhB/YbcL family Raf kinase inhibitor-like protein n=1 Tax=Motilimonas pumila TaxID=2303987 RepID=A0A418YEJ2_9GAMM|nr:YbhB/YbcL family Raf kinase inhibitor-like protein [Motilimonas pumila]RJG47531.1 YbhB/YbcL family Raf kinase inhibitor-like protein [Motilimonas pumila]
MKSLIFGMLLSSAALPASALDMTSQDLVEGGLMDAKFASNLWDCGGKNISPHLKWSNVPEGTKSFVLTVYDPDAPTISGFWHWVAFNIPANVTELPQGAASKGLPSGSVQARNDYGEMGYGGACPPKSDGAHRYQFTIHALKVDKLDLPTDVPPAMVGYQIHLNVIESATIMATYNRD